MNRPTVVCALMSCLVAGPAFAGASTAGSSAGAATSGVGSSASSKITSPDDDKVVKLARDDAASFVATDGRIRGAQLEAALRFLREKYSNAQRASDMQLAQAILAL